MKTKRINVTKENLPKIKEELNWHMKSFTLSCEQEQIMVYDSNSMFTTSIRRNDITASAFI